MDCNSVNDLMNGLSQNELLKIAFEEMVAGFNRNPDRKQFIAEADEDCFLIKPPYNPLFDTTEVTVIENPILDMNMGVIDRDRRIVYVPCMYKFLFMTNPNNFDFAADLCAEYAKRKLKDFIDSL